jgi:hypothetical protein
LFFNVEKRDIDKNFESLRRVYLEEKSIFQDLDLYGETIVFRAGLLEGTLQVANYPNDCLLFIGDNMQSLQGPLDKYSLILCIEDSSDNPTLTSVGSRDSRIYLRELRREVRELIN